VRVPGSVGRHRGRWDREEQGGTARVAVDQQGHLVGGLDLGADEDVALLGVDRGGPGCGCRSPHRISAERRQQGRAGCAGCGRPGARTPGPPSPGTYQCGHSNDAGHSTEQWHGELLTVNDRSGSQEPGWPCGSATYSRLTSTVRVVPCPVASGRAAKRCRLFYHAEDGATWVATVCSVGDGYGVFRRPAARRGWPEGCGAAANTKQNAEGRWTPSREWGRVQPVPASVSRQCVGRPRGGSWRPGGPARR
jgi:hypothetical protein